MAFSEQMDRAGEPESEPVVIAKLTARLGVAGSREDVVRLIIELRPAPQEQKRWWWAEQVSGNRGL